MALKLLGVFPSVDRVIGSALVTAVVLVPVGPLLGAVVGWREWRLKCERLSPTYIAPRDGWVCFHCGERFRNPADATTHFGPTPESRRACILSRAELMDLRAAERRVAVLEAAVRETRETLQEVID